MVEISRILQSVNYIVDADGQRSAVVINVDEWKRLLEWLGTEHDSPEARQSVMQLELVGQQAENMEALKRDEILGGHE